MSIFSFQVSLSCFIFSANFHKSFALLFNMSDAHYVQCFSFLLYDIEDIIDPKWGKPGR